MKTRLPLLAIVGALALSLSACTTDAFDTSVVSAAATGPATLATSATSYTYSSPITVTWSGMPTNATDWIALAPAGSATTSVTRWIYTNGAASGTTQFAGPSTGGSYVVRGFSNDTYTLEGESDAFTVQDPSQTVATLSSQQAVYGLSDPISIDFSGLPGNDHDWIAIAPEGSPLDDQADWQYTNGAASGTIVFMDGLAPTGFPGGSYVARAYLNDTFTLVGESSPFVIGSKIVTDKSAYDVQEPVTVTWSNLPGNAQDWVALAPAGSPTSEVTLWAYTGGGTTGMHTFTTGLATDGNYVARAFLNNTYTLLGESPVFAVNPIGTITVTTDATTYSLGQNVVVSWTGLPGNNLDWISIAPVGSSDSTTTRWVYTGGAASGSATLEGPAAVGSYEARAYLNDTYTRIGQSAPFVVQ